MVNTPGTSDYKENNGIPDIIQAMISTTMTRDRDEEFLKGQNTYFHGNFFSGVNMPRNPVIIDIGSGEGKSIEALHKYLSFLKPKTYGIDIYLPQQKNMQTNFIYQDLNNGLFLPESADRIYSRYTLQYLPNALNIIQDAYNQTNTYKKEDEKKAIGMFHLGPIYKNAKGERIYPLSKELEKLLKSKNQSCNIRIFNTNDKFINGEQILFAGQFLTYEKNDPKSQLQIPDNIVAEKGNMYHPDIRNSEKFINFTIGE